MNAAMRQFTHTYQAAGSYDQAPGHITPQHELLDVETCHDRLAGPGVIRQEEPKGLPWNHLLIDSRDLVR